MSTSLQHFTEESRFILSSIQTTESSDFAHLLIILRDGVSVSDNTTSDSRCGVSRVYYIGCT